MKPKYDDGKIQIYQGDCLKVLKKIGIVDHVITDPPYSAHVHANVATNKGDGSPKKVDLGFDHIMPQTRRWFAKWLAKNVRRWSLIFSDIEGIGAWKTEIQKAELEHVRVGLWVKPNPMPQLTGDRPGSGAEAIEIAHSPGAKRWNGGGKSGIWTHNVQTGQKDRHPTEKPAPLMRDLILDFTDPGEVILDPFMGSGATLRAAKDLGRRAIGIDCDERWIYVAINRLAQGVLPLETERQSSFDLPGSEASWPLKN